MTAPWEDPVTINAAAILSCDIREYCPDDIRVELLKRDDLIDLLLATAALVDIEKSIREALSWAKPVETIRLRPGKPIGRPLDEPIVERLRNVL